MANQDELFQSLYTRYVPGVMAYLMRFGFSRERAEELTQDVFVRVYEHMDDWRQESEWGFLRTTAQRIALNAIREKTAGKRKGKEVPIDSPGVLEPPSGEPPLWEQLAEKDELRRRTEALHAALARLPERLGGPLRLRLLGSSYKEIGKALNLSLDAVKTRIKEAKSSLRATLGRAPEGTDDDDE